MNKLHYQHKDFSLFSSRAVSLHVGTLGAEKKSGVPFKIHVLIEAPPSALRKTRIEDTPRVITHVAHLTYPAFLMKVLAVFNQSQIRKIAYVAAVPCRITRLLFSTVHCATANKRFCPSVSKERRVENGEWRMLRPLGRVGQVRRVGQ